MGFGRLAGAMKPFQDVRTKFGMVSEMAGTPGNCGILCSLETAMTVTFPEGEYLKGLLILKR